MEKIMDKILFQWPVKFGFAKRKKIFINNLAQKKNIILIFGAFAVGIGFLTSDDTVAAFEFVSSYFLAGAILAFLGILIASIHSEWIRVYKDYICVHINCTRYSCEAQRKLLWKDVSSYHIVPSSDSKKMGTITFTTEEGNIEYPYLPQHPRQQKKWEKFLSENAIKN